MKRAEFFEKWIEALESGEYKQCKGILRKGKGGNYSYCCLGVAMKLAKDLGVMKIEIGNDEKILPPEMTKFLGINYIGAFGMFETLANLNDTGKRFKTIARVIREQLAKKNFQKP